MSVADDVTTELTHVGGGRARTSVAVVTPPNSPAHTTAAFLGFAASLDEFELQRFRLLAALTATRYVVVETPGYGTAGTFLSAGERRAAVRGDFRPVAARMDAAAAAVFGSAPDVILGYSMGASLAAAAARRRAEAGSGARALILVEPVAVRKWSPAALMRAMRRENGLVNAYLAETASVPGARPPSDRLPHRPEVPRVQLDMLLSANALRAGRLAEDTLAGLGPGTALVVVHGTESFLSAPADCTRLLDAARHSGVGVTDVAVPGSHGLWQSLPRVTRLAQSLTGVVE